jgi:hypothetical protein
MKIILISLFSLVSLHAEDFPSLANCRSEGCPELNYEFKDRTPFHFDYTSDLPYELIEEVAIQSNHSNSYGLEDTYSDATKMIFITDELSRTTREDDKKKHIEAGAYIGYLSKTACKHGPQLFNLKVRFNSTQQFLCAVAGATIAGVAKEVYDSTDPAHHTVDAKDALFTSLGALSNIPVFKISF